jgi:hypothetical protein
MIRSYEESIMYAPREPNVRPAIEQDPGRIRHSTSNADIGNQGASEMPASPTSAYLIKLRQKDIGKSEIP